MPITDINSERERAFNLELKVKIEVSEENLSITTAIFIWRKQKWEA
jgi:NADH:ubiquinone oxidoreductase subunit C